MICGVYYASDVEARRVVGAALFSSLKADPASQTDSEMARRKLVEARQASH